MFQRNDGSGRPIRLPGPDLRRGFRMFADDCEIVKGFTFSGGVSTRSWDGRVSLGLAAFVVLNDQGWFGTSAHLIDPWLAWRQHRGEIARHREAAARPEVVEGSRASRSAST